MSMNIKAVAERTGVPLHTLRAWERRYGIPRPSREPHNRYRLYDEKDIADILAMKRQVAAGISPAHASAMIHEQSAGSAPRPNELAELSQQFLDALTRRDQDDAERIARTWNNYPVDQIILQMIEPALRQVGERWQQNLLSVEQEHFASNLIRQRLHALIQALPPAAFNAPHLVAACAPEEQHELGLLTVCLLARRQGWQVTYLGQRTPLTDLAIAAGRDRHVVVSVSTVAGLSRLISLWNERMFPPGQCTFGGMLFNRLPRLREHIPGAFLGEDAVTAIQHLAPTQPRRSVWRPERGLLIAAQVIDAHRLPLVGETLHTVSKADGKGNLLPNNGSIKGHWRRELAPHASRLTEPTLFLTDSVIAALGFDVPELMDVQGAWLREFMTARGIEPPMLKAHLETFTQVARRRLPREVFSMVTELVERLWTSVQTHVQTGA